MTKKIQVVTVSSHEPLHADYYTYKEFHKSLSDFGYEAIVLGGKEGEYKGLGSKPKLLKKAILNKTVDADVIIFADSWDSVFVSSPYIIHSFFRNTYNSPWVCSAERNCFPADLKDKFPESPSTFKYLNSGFIIAETAAMLAVLEHMKLEDVRDDGLYPVEGKEGHFEPVEVNDQFLFMKAFIDRPIQMELDYNCLLSQTMCDTNEEDFILMGSHIVNKETGLTPLHIHWNGPAKTGWSREKILKIYGLR